jgi:hydrogenase nickel incorporation protein HypA/HybF
MHELSVTESILEIACRHAEQAQAARVTDVHLVIGRLSSIIDDSVQFYWDLISKETLCEDARLHFKRTPAILTCQDCHQEFELTTELIPCPNCGSARIRVLSGDEFNIESIEIERKS